MATYEGHSGRITVRDLQNQIVATRFVEDVLGLALLPEGNVLAVSTSDGDGVQLWDFRKKRLETLVPGERLLRGPEGGTVIRGADLTITDIAVSGSGGYLAAMSEFSGGLGITPFLELWDLRTGVTRHVAINATGDAVNRSRGPGGRLVFSRDERRVAAIFRDLKVRLLDAETMAYSTLAEVAPVEEVYCAAFHPAGALALGGNFGLRLCSNEGRPVGDVEMIARSGSIAWDEKTEEQVDVEQVVFSPNGKLMAAVVGDNGPVGKSRVMIWSSDLRRLTRRAVRIYGDYLRRNMAWFPGFRRLSRE